MYYQQTNRVGYALMVKPKCIYTSLMRKKLKQGIGVIAIEGIWKNTITKITGTPITDVWRKIILTTDPDLIGVQSIDTEFLVSQYTYRLPMKMITKQVIALVLLFNKLNNLKKLI